MSKKLCLNSTNLMDDLCEYTPNSVQIELNKAQVFGGDTNEAHLTYQEESYLHSLIKNGDVDALAVKIKKLFGSDIFVGDFSEDSLLQSRCLLVAAVTLYTRFAIEGGLSELSAYRLSDAYIKTACNMNNPSKILAMSLSSALDFTKRVKNSRMMFSLPVKKCCGYISDHLYEKITLTDLAIHSGNAPSYLSAAFRKQTGLSPLKYVKEKKLAEARRLLLTTDMPVCAISAQLSFCSHSNFTMCFKKMYGAAPSEYRLQTHSASWMNL